MITINSLKIDQLYENINVDVETKVGNTITKMVLFTVNTYKNYGDEIDLSHLLDGSDETEVLTIPASELEVEKIHGLFWIEFTSDEVIVPDDCDNDSNKIMGVVSNFIKYHNCLLERVLKLEIKGCEEIKDECEDCNQNLPFINTLLSSLNLSLQFAHYEEAIKIVKMLDDMCDICHTCPDYGDTKLINGLGFGTVNNSIVSI